MGLDFDVLEFCKKLRQNRPPPYQCPLEKCDKVYKSLCGLQYHLVNYDHDNPTPVTPAVVSRKKGWRTRAPVPTGDIALQSPPKEALTFAEAQKVVQFEIDGKISRIPIDQPLQVTFFHGLSVAVTKLLLRNNKMVAWSSSVESMVTFV